MTSAPLVPLSHPRSYKVPTCYSATHTGRISERTDTAHAAATPSSSSSGAGYRRSPRGCPAPHIPTAPSMHISRTSVPMYPVHTINMAICTICTLTPCTAPQRRNQRPRSARTTSLVCPPPQRDQAGPFPQDRRSLRPVTSRPKCGTSGGTSISTPFYCTRRNIPTAITTTANGGSLRTDATKRLCTCL